MGVATTQAVTSWPSRVVEAVGADMVKVCDDERFEELRALGVCEDGARWYQMMHDAPRQPNTARLPGRMSSRTAHSLGHVAGDLANTACASRPLRSTNPHISRITVDNALDGFNVSEVQGLTL